jgi:NAD(P)-dependent dehydrogenase (short-subunit alcohol dehydrogenase family)
VLINNAAQTITRPNNWFVKMKQMEAESLPLLKYAALSLITNGDLEDTDSSKVTEIAHDSGIRVGDTDSKRRAVVLDESGQPLDVSGVNSWSRRLVDVSREELIHTMNVNAVAPFIIMRKLKVILTPSKGGGSGSSSGGGGDRYATPLSQLESINNAQVFSRNESLSDNPTLHNAGLVVNVTALEGKFNVGKKSSGHPHTNMAKAALNMLTLTCAREWARSAVYVSSVDTG